MAVPAGPGGGADLLATVSDLQVVLGETIDTGRATLLLEVATAAVQAAAGGQRILEVVDDEITIDVDDLDGGEYLTLPQIPVTAVTTVVVGATTVTDYAVQLHRGRLWRAMGWRSAALPGYPSSPSMVTVTYTHGYAVGDQRLALARAVALSLAAAAYTAPAGGGVIREAIDDYSVQFAEGSGQMVVLGATAILLRRTYGRSPISVRLVRS